MLQNEFIYLVLINIYRLTFISFHSFNIFLWCINFFNSIFINYNFIFRFKYSVSFHVYISFFATARYILIIIILFYSMSVYNFRVLYLKIEETFIYFILIFTHFFPLFLDLIISFVPLLGARRI